MKADRQKQIQALRILGLTEEDVAQVLADDDRIDKGEKLFELSEELEKGAKKARSAGNTKGYTKANREKKADVEKGKLIADLLNGIPYAENVEIINAER